MLVPRILQYFNRGWYWASQTLTLTLTLSLISACTQSTPMPEPHLQTLIVCCLFPLLFPKTKTHSAGRETTDKRPSLLEDQHKLWEIPEKHLHGFEWASRLRTEWGVMWHSSRQLAAFCLAASKLWCWAILAKCLPSEGMVCPSVPSCLSPLSGNEMLPRIQLCGCQESESNMRAVNQDPGPKPARQECLPLPSPIRALLPCCIFLTKLRNNVPPAFPIGSFYSLLSQVAGPLWWVSTARCGTLPG